MVLLDVSFIFLAIALVIFTISSTAELLLKGDLNRDPRLFPFFGFGVGLVRFENGVCTSADGLQGTCYTKRQCRDNNGLSSGGCAAGIGVCCVFQASCGDTSALNNTYFVSPNYPSTLNGGSSCTLTIQRCSADICQIRIDFLNFNLAQPNADGVCTTDAFNVIGGSAPVPTLCGDNTGQHIYVDFNDANSIQLVMSSLSSTPWNMKITQIGCNCPTKAPTGCLQYFQNTTSGVVRSFNYGTTGTQLGTRQLVNQNYGVCVEMLPGYCSITWSEVGGNPYAFSVSNNTNTAIGMGTAGTAAASQTGTNCTTDFVVIPNPYYTANGTGVGSDRFCGNGFPSVTTGSKPFVMTVVTNGNETGDSANRGFALMFMQNRCANTMLG